MADGGLAHLEVVGDLDDDGGARIAVQATFSAFWQAGPSLPLLVIGRGESEAAGMLGR